MLKQIRLFIQILFLTVVTVGVTVPVSAKSTLGLFEADRAVEIAQQSRDRVEFSSKGVHSASRDLFQSFAERTVELQKLLDARRELESAGFLHKDDPDGIARRAHINGQILLEVGKLKQECDNHLPGLLGSLESFDSAVAASLIDSQATRSINSNYELALDQYLKQERSHYLKASKDAEKSLDAYQNERDPRLKERAQNRYRMAKQRLRQIEMRRQLYEARLMASEMNQKVSNKIREKIRLEGHSVPTRFRQVIASLYTTFARITPIAEVGGTSAPDIWGQLGFANLEEMNNSLQVVDGAIGKLDGVLNDMVTDVMSGLSNIQSVDDAGSAGGSFSVEEEVEYLRKQRESWEG
ncbi:MAG: hypothetical protein U9R29_06615 [Thermodesulfobacteriota bacterium]|nr:hypothetical protein [Thermodesulfobacteriota bacterium]